MTTAQAASPIAALRLHLRGHVQGLGARPAVARLARQLALAGAVRNTLRGLEIEIEGPPDRVREFVSRLPQALPAACVYDVGSENIAPAGRGAFAILRDQRDGPLSVPPPPDTAVCGQCLAEAANPRDRRFRYPLISCAACGPRYSIIRRMPYERDDTAMAEFSLCESCRAEYASPHDRRCHAQTIACAECGPHVWAVAAGGRLVGRCEAAIAAAAEALRQGRIVALRGLGGYQILCDAQDQTAVERLRARKHRPAKPLAVLVRTLADVRRLAQTSAAEERLLSSPANPIVLLQPRPAARLAPSVRMGLNTIGILLPTTALHDLLLAQVGRPLVCTSGNREGEPLEYEPRAAEQRLAGMADLWLHHDRPIERPVDDSVVRIMAGKPVTIRLARGLAPRPLDLPAAPPVFALGGHQKSALAWCNGAQCALGPHVGDLETLPARERLRSVMESSASLYGFQAQHVAHDAHPHYYTTHLAAELGLPRWPVPHHFAHVAAAMLDGGLLRQRVLGLAFDGSGFGPDGTIWGGEFIVADDAAHMRRVAHLRPFVLPGGETAIREPWRVAVSVLSQALGIDALSRNGAAGIEPSRVRQLLPLLTRPRLHVATTSAGRLFDACACLILSRHFVDYEGQAAMELEAAASAVAGDADAQCCYPLPLTEGDLPQLDWRPLVAALHHEATAGVDPPVMAKRFHRALARGMANLIRRFALPAVLGGGVFQNRLLTEMLLEELDGHQPLHLPGGIPPNDGGLAAGQLAIALTLLRAAV